MKKIKDQFKNEFQSLTLEGDSFYIDDAAERPLGLIPYGEPVQEVIPEELGTTVEGESVVVVGGNPEKEVKDTIYGMSKQNTTEGYNLLPYPYVNTTKTINGITFTDNGDGTVTANGTATDTAYFYCKTQDIEPYFNMPKGKYKLSGCPSDGSNTTYLIGLGLYKDTTRLTGITDTGNGSTIDTNSYDYNRVMTYIQIASGTTVNNLVFKPMIYEGTENKSYEPYTGGQASPNTEYEQDIEVIDGVNILENNVETQTIDGLTVTVNENKSMILNGTTTQKITLYFKRIGKTMKAGSYTISNGLDKEITGVRLGVDIGTTYYNTGTKRIIELSEEALFGTPYIQVDSGITLNDLLIEPMIHKGTSDLPYLPYRHIGLLQSSINKYNIRDVEETTQNGITYSIKNGRFKANGTATGAIKIETKNNRFNLDSGDYTFGTKVISGTYSGIVGKYVTKTDGVTLIDGGLIDGLQIKTLTENYTNLYAHIYISSGVTFNNYEAEIMLVEGTYTKDTLPTFEPYYYNLIPIDLAGNKLAKVGEIADLLNIGGDGSVKIGDKVIKRYVFTGDEKFIRQPNANGLYYFYTDTTLLDNGSLLIYSNYFKMVDDIWLLTEKRDGIKVSTNKFSTINIMAKDYDTLESFKAWLKEKNDSGEPLYVDYVLANPETIHLPSIKPIKLIEGITNVFELVTNLGTTMALTYDYVTPSPSIDRPSEILTVEGSYSTELQNEYATITNTLPLTLTNELLGEIVTLTEEEAKQLNLDGAGKYRRSDLSSKIRLTSDMSWYISSNGNWYYTEISNLSKKIESEILSTHFRKGNWVVKPSENIICLGTSADPMVGISQVTFDSIDSLKAFLDENEVYIIGQLQIPTYEKITYETELAQLSAYDKQIAFFGINNINTYPTDDLVKAPLKLKITYDKSNRIL